MLLFLLAHCPISLAFQWESSVHAFVLSCSGEEGSVCLLEAMFTSICDALCESDCLEGGRDCVCTPVEDMQMERAVENFAEVLVNEKTGTITMERMCHALSCTTTAKVLNVCFCRSQITNVGIPANRGARSHSCLRLLVGLSLCHITFRCTCSL